MSAILYMVRKDCKNRILALFRHPAKLIMYLFLVALLGFSLINVAFAPTPELGETFADIRILHGAYFGILLFFMGVLVLNALQKGTTFFGMADVNLLFVAPLSPRKILAYGLVKQMGRTLLMVFFFLFYGAMLAQTFGIVWTDTLALVIGSAAALFVVQMLSLLLYNVTNGHPGRIRTAKGILYLYVAAVVGIVALDFTAGG
ncbi:putative ABC exporter domain-containing protein, partial [Blautia wexlerae]|nr:putative ABC exporter domain-containing protein [Blautia wexlerae]